MILRVRLACVFLLAFAAFAQRIEFLVLKEGVLEQRLRSAHKKNDERFARLRALFEETGCRGDSIREQKVGGSKQPNLVCTVPGFDPTASKIVVGAHFDSVGGDGVIDNWSGAVLLPSLAEFTRKKPKRHTFEFVGFAGEEQGLLGSRGYLKHVSKEDRRHIVAMIGMDSLGLGPVKSWPNGSTRELLIAASTVAASLNLSFSGVNMDNVGTTDSAVFKDAKIPVLSLHSVTQETWTTINSAKDVWSAVSWRDYYDTHRFISALLAYLDQTLE